LRQRGHLRHAGDIERRRARVLDNLGLKIDSNRAPLVRSGRP
jgi:hypothetical protein